MFEIIGADDEKELKFRENLPEIIECEIFDWQEDMILTYNSMMGKGYEV